MGVNDLDGAAERQPDVEVTCSDADKVAYTFGLGGEGERSRPDMFGL